MSLEVEILNAKLQAFVQTQPGCIDYFSHESVWLGKAIEQTLYLIGRKDDRKPPGSMRFDRFRQAFDRSLQDVAK